jgi:hypothetical protein
LAAAAWIALYIGEGILQRLGGYVFDAIFPYFKDEEQRELVEKLATRFRQILREEEVRQAGANLLALMNEMIDYTNQQGDQPDRLVDATSHAQLLVSELASLDLQGFDAYLIAAGLQLAVIQARYWNPELRDEGEKTNALRHIQVSSDHVDRMKAEMTQVLSARFGPVFYWGSPVYSWFYIQDGGFQGSFATEEAAKAAEDSRYSDELQHLLTEEIHPAELVQARWSAIAQQVPNWDKFLVTSSRDDITL